MTERAILAHRAFAIYDEVFRRGQEPRILFLSPSRSLILFVGPALEELGVVASVTSKTYEEWISDFLRIPLKIRDEKVDDELSWVSSGEVDAVIEAFWADVRLRDLEQLGHVMREVRALPSPLTHGSYIP